MKDVFPSWFPVFGESLGVDCPLPIHRPFTPAEAATSGVPARLVHELIERGVLRRVTRGVYAASQLEDSIETRAQALSLVVPASAVVVDRTAAWFHGVPILPRRTHPEIPPISVFQREGTRVRRAGVTGGKRALLDRDVQVVCGVRVTSPARTALDLGRMLWRFDALAALDGFLRMGVDQGALLADSDRFRGFRGVCQLRDLLQIADGRAESPGESALRLHWYDAGLPRPELQWWVEDDDGNAIYRLDLALPEHRYCAEYDGQQFHLGVRAEAHDERRRSWLRTERSWTVEVFRKEAIYALGANPTTRLISSYDAARAA